MATSITRSASSGLFALLILCTLISLQGCAFLVGDLTGVGVGAIAGSATKSPVEGAAAGGLVGTGTGALAGYALGAPVAGAIGGGLAGTIVGYASGRASAQK